MLEVEVPKEDLCYVEEPTVCCIKRLDGLEKGEGPNETTFASI